MERSAKGHFADAHAEPTLCVEIVLGPYSFAYTGTSERAYLYMYHAWRTGDKMGAAKWLRDFVGEWKSGTMAEFRRRLDAFIDGSSEELKIHF